MRRWFATTLRFRQISGMHFVCERHVGKKIPRVLQDELHADIVLVEVNPDPGDNAVVVSANTDDRTIVTRDSEFTTRPICSINGGVIFIPQTLDNVTVKLDDVLDCLRKIGASGLLDVLGHGVCSVMPDGVSIQSLDGTKYISIDEF